MASSRILKESATSQAATEINDVAVYMNGQMLEQWYPIVQFHGLARLVSYITDSGSRAWMVTLESLPWKHHGNKVIHFRQIITFWEEKNTSKRSEFHL